MLLFGAAASNLRLAKGQRQLCLGAAILQHFASRGMAGFGLVNGGMSTTNLLLMVIESSMADYEHDIFISYRRSDVDWVRWTRENFVRALTSLLRVRLGPIKVFVDETIEDGASWPNHLAMSLSRSRIMVAVLSRDYFQSDWCRLELALMHHREKSGSLRTAANPWGLIIPVVIDDGNCFPPEVQAMQGEQLHSFANPFMRPDSPKQEAMADVMRSKLCTSIERALAAVPVFDPAWEQVAHKQFEGVFRVHMQSQKTVPSLTLPIS